MNPIIWMDERLDEIEDAYGEGMAFGVATICAVVLILLAAVLVVVFIALAVRTKGFALIPLGMTLLGFVGWITYSAHKKSTN